MSVSPGYNLEIVGYCQVDFEPKKLTRNYKLLVILVQTEWPFSKYFHFPV